MTENDTRLVMVSIRCTVYNHEPYLRDCLNGFVMQKTNFRFEAIVHDDASTDGSAAIIREYAEKYPDIIKPIYETENQWSKHDGSLGRIMERACSGKYIAYCEGDDYWIDPNKLQKQVDLLEKDESNVLCYSKARTFNQTVKMFEHILGQCYQDKDEILTLNAIPTATVVLRKDTYNKYISERERIPLTQWKMGDYPLWIYMSLYGDFVFLDKVTSVYRILQTSASHSTSLEKQEVFHKSTYDIQRYFINHYFPNKIYLLPIIESNYHRRLFLEGIARCNRRYAFTHLKKISNKSKMDICSLLALYIPGMFNVFCKLAKNRFAKFIYRLLK